MEQQGNQEVPSGISVESKRSKNSSCRSLDRPSWGSRERSLNKNRSLIEVMSLDSSKKSDLYERLLAGESIKTEHFTFPIVRTSTNHGKFISQIPAPEPAPQQEDRIRYSYDPNMPQMKDNEHICLCQAKRCQGEMCPCYETPQETCTVGFCCKDCIQAKIIATQRATIARLSSRDEVELYCTCKKSQCIKGYCRCFSTGVKCGSECKCVDCLNSDPVERMQPEPVCVVDEQTKQKQMPEAMDFEPPSFQDTQSPYSFRYSIEQGWNDQL